MKEVTKPVKAVGNHEESLNEPAKYESVKPKRGINAYFAFKD